MRSARCSHVLLVAGSSLLAASTGAAQDTPPTAWGRGQHATASASEMSAIWLAAWSPLRSIVDAPRGLLRAPLAPGLFDAPSPRAGAFILAGAPGSLARDFTRRGDTSSFGELRARQGSESGTFRRPLDVAESSVLQVSGQGYSKVGARGTAIGRFIVDQEEVATSSVTARVQPYVAFPVVSTDTLEPPMQRTRARLEGALAWRVAGFGVGVAAGLDSREHHSVNAPLRRSGRAAIPAATVGVEHAFNWLDLRAGGFYRWSEANETNLLRPSPGTATRYPLRALDEPFGVELTPLQSAFTRNERRTTGIGGTVAATVFDADMVLLYERGRRAEDETGNPFLRIRPDVERWRATGSEWRAMAQRTVRNRVTATLVVSAEASDGEGTRAEFDGVSYVGSNSRRAIEIDLRTPADRSWSVAVLGGVVQMEHALDDFVSQLEAATNVSTPFVGGEVGKRLGRGAIAAGVSYAQMTPTRAGLPAVAERGERYRLLIAPAWSYEVAEATAVAGWVTAQWRVSNTLLLGSVRAERASPRTVVASRLQPGGERSVFSVSLGVRP
jgi:hypothetical protein